MNRKYLFLYPSGHKKRIAFLKNSKGPIDFLYGFTVFQDKGVDVDYLETDLIPHKKKRLEYWTLLNKN